MENGVMVVGTNPVVGREDEFNEWYSTEHIPDLLAVPGIVSARRYVALDEPDAEDAEPQYRYLALYEIEGSIPAVLGAMAEADIEQSPAMDEQTSVAVYSSFPPKATN